ncbi:MAG: S8 family serine peptidase [Verrucomicrobiota bacterium JB023]|nr:S8 family serine peptidase [Verrucomicrobiota bacterium JB023]
MKTMHCSSTSSLEFAKRHLLILAITSLPAWAQGPLTSGPKLGGGGTNPLNQSFINSDKAWYQDARQAYHGDDLAGADGQLAKLDWSLAYTSFQWSNWVANNPGTPFSPDHEVYPYAEGKTLVEVACNDNEAWTEVEPALAALGATSITHQGSVINAWVPVDRLGPASQLDGITFIRPAYRENRSGLTTSQGDSAVQADLARSISPGVTGQGITIGTLSDSFATAPTPSTTATEDVSNNDLPGNIEVLSEFAQPATDEGRAMMQIIHDLAPGAEQKFFTAFNGQAAFANGIRSLAAAGCDIIVDDVFFFAEPFFQNGLIAQAVNEVSAAGKPYFSAAGNSARQSYESGFRFADGFSGLSGGPLHDFDAGPGIDAFQSFTIPVGSAVTFVLQWDEPFFSVSGAPGCQSDIDIFLTGSGDGQFNVLSGAFSRNLGGDAVDIFSFTNNGTIDIDGQPGPDTEFNLAIEGLTGTAPNLMKILFINRGDFAVNEFDTQSSTLVGHANAQNAIAVAAAPFSQTPAFGAAIPQLESFSSPGGSLLLFADDGTRLPQPIDTAQPRITSADGGNTTFFGQVVNDGDSFPNFFGTSAAAPHAAAVAALLLESAGGPDSLTPVQLLRLLEQTAVDMGSPGFDSDSGFGLIDAEGALTRLAENRFGDPLLSDIFMDEDNQSWLNPKVWDNDAAPSPDFDYVLSPVGNNIMRSSPQNQIAAGPANFPGNSLTVPSGTRLLLKQQSETASINGGIGDLILDGGTVSFGPNGNGSPVFDVADFHVTSSSGSILEIASSIRDNAATIDGRLTGRGDLLVRLGDGGTSFTVNRVIAFAEVDEAGYTGKLTVQGRGPLGNATLDFNTDVNFTGGAGLELIGKGTLRVDQALTFQANKVSDPVNGTVPPGVYAGDALEALGPNYLNAGGILTVLPPSGQPSPPLLERIDFVKTGGSVTQVDVTFTNLQSGLAYDLHRSTDLITFDALVDRATVEDDTFTFSDQQSPPSKAFYRLSLRNDAEFK